MSTTLIQLVSEQTMQNLLPVLALEPSHLIHLTTPKSHATSERIAEACRRAGLTVQVETISMSAMPSLPETTRAVHRAVEFARAAGSQPVLNFTGGTKLMSIGAWEAAKLANIPSLYVDTQERRFWNGETGDFTHMAAALSDFEEVAKKLRVDLVAFANGITRTTSGRAYQPFVSLSHLLLSRRELERKTWDAINGREGFLAAALGNSGYAPRDANQVLYLLDTPILDLPESVADAALACGMLEESADGCHLASHADGISLREAAEHLLSNRMEKLEYRQCWQALRNAVQFPLSILSGAWLEVVAAHAMEQSGKFHDIRWSLQVGEKDGYDLEEDVVALDGVQLAYVSCKRSGRLHAHAEEIRARANRIGGIFSRCYYVIHEMPYGTLRIDLKKRCQELGGIRLIASEDFLSTNPFDSL